MGGVGAKGAPLGAEEEGFRGEEALVEDGFEIGDVVGPPVGAGIEGKGNVVCGVVPPLAVDGVVVVAVFAAEIDSGHVFFPCGVKLELIRVGVDLAGDDDVVLLEGLARGRRC